MPSAPGVASTKRVTFLVSGLPATSQGFTLVVPLAASGTLVQFVANWVPSAHPEYGPHQVRVSFAGPAWDLCHTRAATMAAATAMARSTCLRLGMSALRYWVAAKSAAAKSRSEKPQRNARRGRAKIEAPPGVYYLPSCSHPYLSHPSHPYSSRPRPSAKPSRCA